MFGVSLGGEKYSLSCVRDVALNCRLEVEVEVCCTATQLAHTRDEGVFDPLRNS